MCDKLHSCVSLLTFYLYIFNFSNVISEMSIKRQSPAQRGVMISNRISLAMEEDGQSLKPERPSSRSFDSRRYFLLCYLPLPRGGVYKKLLMRNILNLVPCIHGTMMLHVLKEI